ncbi:MAG TPA: glycosyltransferase family 2 protein [Flavobacteriales bacterium]
MALALVSIIIPVYNAERTLQRALLSAIHQTYPFKEIIVIDGASTDGSLDIIRELGNNLAFTLSEKDSGVYSAINKGIDHAKGDWIYILGADDAFENDDVLQKVMNARLPESKLLYGDVKNEMVSHRLVPSLHKSSFGSELKWKNTLHQQGAFYHRSLFKQFRFDEQLIVLADYDFHLKLWKENIPAQRIDTIIAKCEASGLSKQFIWSLYKEELLIKKRRLSTLPYLINLPLVVLKYWRKKLF